MKKNKFCFVAGLCAFLLCAGDAFAIKADPKPVKVVQPDGTTLVVRQRGDESFHFTVTTDGYMVRKDKDGFFKYVVFDGSGRMVLSAQRASAAAERSEQEKAFLSSVLPAAKMIDRMDVKEAGVKAPAVLLDRKVFSPLASAGGAEDPESNYLVILVNYKDVKMQIASSRFDNWLNEPGYDDDGGTGSVRDYYIDNSMGKFAPRFTVIGPIELDNNMVYYAGNTMDTGEDQNPRAMISEACLKAKEANPDLDFSIFDNDGDGIMDNVNVIYAGYSEASTANPDDMWPHSWNMGEEAFYIDGVKIMNYACSAELVGESGVKMDGIGTFVHEFGHVLGLKDMYDTDSYTDGYGLDPGAYSLYASGSYNNESRTPPYLMAFERVQMGWLEPSELKEAADIALKSIGENEACYINARPGLAAGEGYEWFVLENRQQTGWDKYIPAHGLLIYHYDYTKEMQDEYWSINGPNNNAKHRCLYIKPADGIDDENSRNGDTYPGLSGNTEFTDTSVPNALNWAGQKTNVPVTNINESNGIVYFQVSGGVEKVSQIKTIALGERDKTITVGAEVVNAVAEIAEMGFCWELGGEPDIESSHASVEVADNVQYTIEGLEPGMTYQVRAYMKHADGTVVYGAAIPVTTECEVRQAPYVGDFMSWTNGQPDCWKIVDRNGDGTTWLYDDTSGSMVYQFDYWNNADDWLISTRFLVPENGVFCFVRGVLESTCVETLEVYVSTKSRNIEDFHLVRRMTFADNFGVMTPEEVDLSAYEGKEVYIALVCRSEKLQNSLWISQYYFASRLDTPQITKFDSTDGGLQLEWNPVKGAQKYYLMFSEETDETYTNAVFVPESYYTRLDGDVEVGTGLIDFTGDAVAELKEFPDGVFDCRFILTASGPLGTTVLNIEGTTDGSQWTQIGPSIKVSQSDNEGSEHLLADYMDGKLYKKLRIRCEYGGRNVRIKYFTILFNDGKVENMLAEGGLDNVTSYKIVEKTTGEFLSGKKYVARLCAGDGVLFYDESAPAYFQHNAVDEAGAAETVAYADRGTVTVAGISAGDRITCISASGTVIADFVALHTNVSFGLDGYRGLVIVKVAGNDGVNTYKLMIND